jgi:hypothetical protein
MTVHAFADESRRGTQYLIAMAIASPCDLRGLRRDLRALLLPGQRELHFKREKESRQRQIADAIARLPAEVHIYLRRRERYEETARQSCIAHLMRYLLDRGAHRLVLDSRAELDVHDENTIRAAVVDHPHHPRFVYEHVDSVGEPLLWIADTAAWCFGAGGHWRKRVDRIITTITDLG